MKMQISGHGMIDMKNVIFLTCRPAWKYNEDMHEKLQ